jgi:plastocyanin
MTRLLPTAVACLSLAALLLIGCGSDSSSDTGSTANPAPATDTAASDTGGTTTAAGVEVSIKDIKFNPESVTAKAGTTITWTNDDPVPHNVTAPQAGIESGTIEPGKTFAFVVEKAGTIDYVCTIHPGQKGSITVTAG